MRRICIYLSILIFISCVRSKLSVNQPNELKEQFGKSLIFADFNLYK